MAVTAPPSLDRPPAAGRPVLGARKRPVADRSFQIVTLASGLLVLAVLALIAIAMTQKAMPAFRYEGFSFVTSKRWDPTHGHFGALAFIFGTVVSSAIALVVAVPVSVGIALVVSEIAPRRVRRPVVYVIDLLAAVPSVVFGLWGFSVASRILNGFYRDVADVTHGLPLLGRVFAAPNGGRTLFTAGLVLALMITPIITSLSREVFETVPPAQKEAALALGSTRWEMIRGAMFPWSRAGVVAAVLLGLARAMGETIAVALVIGSSARIGANLFGPGDSMAGVIVNSFGEASGTYRAALLGLGVVLFAITIIVNIGARAVLSRSEARAGGPA
jgi:phosphate transport system permease protein